MVLALEERRLQTLPRQEATEEEVNPTCDPKTHPSPCACCQWRLEVEIPRLMADSAKLRQRVEELEHTIGIYEATGPIQFLKAQNKKLLERVAEQAEALILYGDHGYDERGMDCLSLKGDEFDCNCGFAAVLAKHNKEKP